MNYEYLIEQSESYCDKHEYPQAVAYATRAIEADPSRVDAYYWRGFAFRRSYAQDYAREDAEALLSCTASTALHVAYRGWAYIMLEDYKQAVDACTEALEQDDTVKEAYLYRAWAYDELGGNDNIDKAVADCKEVTKFVWKYNQNAYNILGVAHKNKGEFDLAIENYNKAIEIDPKFDIARNNRLYAFHAKDKLPKIDAIRENKTNMSDLRGYVNNVVPFLGAGVSKPYGYYTWRELLHEILNECCRQYNVTCDTTKESIRDDIKNGSYMEAIEKMDKLFSTLNYAVQVVTKRQEKCLPDKVGNVCSILSEYLHLFPSKKYLTTNFDTVIRDILKHQGQKVCDPILPTSKLKLSGDKAKKIKDRMNWTDEPEPEGEASTVYYLHGIYTDSDSIVLSKVHYDEFYGYEGDIKSNLRRVLPSLIYSIYHNSVFLFIGCGMTVAQDRILKVLREFCGSLPNLNTSYALLNVNDFAKTPVPFEDWNSLDDIKQQEFNKALDEKEAELAHLNVRIIWFSAPNNSDERHESAKRQLLRYLLEDTRKKVKEAENDKKSADARMAKYDTEREISKNKRETERVRAELDGNSISDSESATLQNDAQAFVLSEEQLIQIQEFFQSKMYTKQVAPTKCEIEFPMYKIGGGLYTIYLVSECGKFYLSDDGSTYKELDKIFELKEFDVIKNLVAILKQYGCRKQPYTNAFIIDCTLKDVHVKMSYLIQAISFMLNMKIFYI